MIKESGDERRLSLGPLSRGGVRAEIMWLPSTARQEWDNRSRHLPEKLTSPLRIQHMSCGVSAFRIAGRTADDVRYL